MFITFFIVLSICYLTFFYYSERAECESERQTLIASIEQHHKYRAQQLRKISQRRKLEKTKKRRLKTTN